MAAFLSSEGAKFALMQYLNNREETTQAPAQAKDVNAGKWTVEEVHYCQGLIVEFRDGNIADLEEGTSLRNFLSKKLNCSPKRISKKFERSGYNGRHIYKKSQLSVMAPGEARMRRERIKDLEDAYLESRKVLKMVEESRKKSAISTSPQVMEKKSPLLGHLASDLSPRIEQRKGEDFADHLNILPNTRLHGSESDLRVSSFAPRFAQLPSSNAGAGLRAQLLEEIHTRQAALQRLDKHENPTSRAHVQSTGAAREKSVAGLFLLPSSHVEGSAERMRGLSALLNSRPMSTIPACSFFDEVAMSQRSLTKAFALPPPSTSSRLMAIKQLQDKIHLQNALAMASSTVALKRSHSDGCATAPPCKKARHQHE